MSERPISEDSADKLLPACGGRVSVRLLLLLGLMLFALLAGSYLMGTWAGRMEVDGEGVDGPGASRQPAGAPLGREKPLNVEILLEEGLLLVGTQSRGRCRLDIDSRLFGRPAKAHCTIVAGSATPRNFELSGASRVDGLREGRQWFEIRGPSGIVTERLIALFPGQKQELSIAWERKVSLQGLVFASEGKPIKDAVVLMAGKETRTDEKGQFRLEGIVAGKWLPIRIRAHGYASVVEVLSADNPAGMLEGLRFLLREGITLEGQVQIPAEERRFVRLALLPRSLGKTLAFPFAWKGRYSDFRIDAQGFYRIEGLRGDLPVTLGLAHPRYYLDAPVWIDLSQKTRLAHVTANVFPRPGKRLFGRVWELVDGKRKGVAGLRLSAKDRREGAWGLAHKDSRRGEPLEAWIADLGACTCETDEQGRYSFALPGKRALVTLRKEGYLGQRREFGNRVPQSWDFTVVPGEGAPGESRDDAANAASLELRFRAAPGSAASELPPLRVSLKWNGKLVEQPFLHDARKVLVHRLSRSAVVKLRWRLLGSEFQQEEVEVFGRTPVLLDLRNN